MTEKSEDAFLKSLQEQALSDGTDLVQEMRAHADQLGSQLQVALQELRRPLHTLKGNFESVGFGFFSRFSHQIEDELQRIENCAGTQESLRSPESLVLLSFYFGDVLESLECYIADLKLSLADSEALLSKRIQPLSLLCTWGVETEGAAPAGDSPTPVPSETPAPVVQVAPDPVSLPPQPVTLTPPGPETFLLCRQATHSLAIPVRYVEQVARPAEWIRAPGSPERIRGLMRLRDQVVPILDLSQDFGSAGDEPYIVLCRKDTRLAGFPVNTADRVVVIPADRFQTLDPRQGSLLPKGVRSFFIEQGQTVLIVEMEEWLAA